MADLAAIFRKPFPEQVAAFRLRLGDLVPTARWDDPLHSAHDRAFMVAGAVKADLLADLAHAVDKAISEGTSLDEFRRDFRAIVARRGWHGWTGEGTAAGEAWRTRVVYRTNARTTYAAGRYAQLVDGGFDYWVYRHGASLEPRPIHLHEWDGLILPPDHAFWNTHYAPNGWGCSCYVVGARSIEGARRLGGDPDKPLPANWREIDPKTGVPVGIDKGWAYAPGASVAETVTLAARKMQDWPAMIGAPFGDGFAGIIERIWPVWFAETQAGITHDPTLVGSLSAALVRRLEMLGRSPASAEIMVRPGLVKGPKATRHARKGDALPEELWLTLPRRLREPQAVLLDRRSGNLLFYLGNGNRPGQIVVVLDYYTRKPSKGSANMIVSAYVPNLAEVRRRLASGSLEILSGSLE